MATLSNRTWSDIVALVRSAHPELVRRWFDSLEPVELDHGVLGVRIVSTAHHQYLTRQCQQAFNEAAQTATGRLITITFLSPPPPEESDRPLRFEAETDQIVLCDEYNFENFVTGPCNQLAHAACIAASDTPGRVYNPLFIHGNVGLGKTHLLQAACHRIRAADASAKVLYISCETFTNHFVEAIERGALQQFRDRYRYVGALIIDDIQYLAAGERTREEFFHTFNTLFQSQRQIILSADEPPRKIPGLEDRLVSRFSWGLVAPIDPPSLETRMAIARKKAKLRCIDLPDGVAHYIAATATSNTREIEGALTKIIALSQQYGGTIDLNIAKEALADDDARQQGTKITMQDILQAVMDRFNVRLADLQGKRRSRSLAFPRQVCMYLARELTPLSLEEIGGYFGGRDHTTVLHATRAIQGQRDRDPELQATLRHLAEDLRRRRT